MLFITLLAWLNVPASAVQDTVRDVVSVYAPVLEHLQENRPALPIVLDEVVSNVACTVRCGDRTALGRHPAEVLSQLQSKGLVQATCELPGSPECSSTSELNMHVSLGPVIYLPADARVKVQPEETKPGVSPQQALARVPDSAAVLVHAAVDVVVRTPCPAPPESDRCRVPDVIHYRYFLSAEPDGTYRVATRHIAGAI